MVQVQAMALVHGRVQAMAQVQVQVMVQVLAPPTVRQACPSLPLVEIRTFLDYRAAVDTVVDTVCHRLV